MSSEQETMSVNEFSKLVFAISQQLKCSDVEALKYIYRVTDESISNLGVLRILEKRGVFSSGNITGLRDLLSNIQRCDLLDMLRTVEDKRLKLCYFQAMSIEDQLKAIQEDLMQFGAKQECSPTERSFCGKVASKVMKIQREMKDYLIEPLKEINQEAYTDERLGNTKVGSRSNRPRSTGDTATAISMRPQQLHRPNNSLGNEVFTSRQLPTQQNQRLQDDDDDDDYDTLCPVGEPREAAHPEMRSVQDTFRDTKRVNKWRVAVSGTPAAAGDRTCRKSAGSAPGTPLSMHKSRLSKSSSADNLMASSQGSNIPVPKRKLVLSPRNPDIQKTLSSGSDVEGTGSGDSGFSDPSEFLQPRMMSREHIYTSPSKHTMNAPSVYSVLTKRSTGSHS